MYHIRVAHFGLLLKSANSGLTSADVVLGTHRYTAAVLREHLDRLNEEKAAFGESYHDERRVFCWEDGRRIYPDTITESSMPSWIGQAYLRSPCMVFVTVMRRSLSGPACTRRS